METSWGFKITLALCTFVLTEPAILKSTCVLVDPGRSYFYHIYECIFNQSCICFQVFFPRGLHRKTFTHNFKSICLIKNWNSKWLCRTNSIRNWRITSIFVPWNIDDFWQHELATYTWSSESDNLSGVQCGINFKSYFQFCQLFLMGKSRPLFLFIFIFSTCHNLNLNW